jgi:hypothetical protein
VGVKSGKLVSALFFFFWETVAQTLLLNPSTKLKFCPSEWRVHLQRHPMVATYFWDATMVTYIAFQPTMGKYGGILKQVFALLE